jgi:hypothetical protein
MTKEKLLSILEKIYELQNDAYKELDTLALSRDKKHELIKYLNIIRKYSKWSMEDLTK